MAESAPAITDGVLVDFVDYLLPLLRPYEAKLYLLLLRRSHLAGNGSSCVIGLRSIASALGQGQTEGVTTSDRKLPPVIDGLVAKGCILVGEKGRSGTRYTVLLPEEIPSVRQAMSAQEADQTQLDYYTDPVLRDQLFERDGRRCRYCGEVVSTETATLDHIVPRSKGGTNHAENLATACLSCNSIKSGRTYEEAAADILRAVRNRQT